jgi:hypothetical protein
MITAVAAFRILTMPAACSRSLAATSFTSDVMSANSLQGKHTSKM